MPALPYTANSNGSAAREPDAAGPRLVLPDAAHLPRLAFG